KSNHLSGCDAEVGIARRCENSGGPFWRNTGLIHSFTTIYLGTDAPGHQLLVVSQSLGRRCSWSFMADAKRLVQKAQTEAECGALVSVWLRILRDESPPIRRS